MRNVFKDLEPRTKQMRGGFLREKAIFMMFLIVTLSFTVANLDQVSAASNVCCEMTTSGDTCLYTSEENCATGYLSTSTSCEQTSYCEPGVCISGIGQCSEAVSKRTCEELGYSWQPGTTAEIQACQKECCVIADGAQAAYTTEKHCVELIRNLEDIELDWRDVSGEAECTAIAQNADRGCCVTPDSCTFQAKGDCTDAGIDFEAGTGFFKDTFCADLGACECIPRVETRCIDEDVYYFDSCGNQEDLADDCSYLDGDWCGTNEEGKAACLNVECKTTFEGEYYIDPLDPGEKGSSVDRNPHDDGIGGPRQHGESWCLYESPAGGYKDFPGSQHYRSYCYFGEEIIEPCEDFRKDVCLQIPYDNYKELSPEGIWNEKSGYEGGYTGPTGSRCIDNDENLFLSPNVTTVPLGGSFWSEGYGAESCTIGDELDCPMVYATTGRADKTFQLGQGVMCTSPQWTKLTADICRSKGDCGIASNLVGEFSSDGFRLEPSVEFLSKKMEDDTTHKVFIGYDECVDHDLGHEGVYHSNIFKGGEEKLNEQAGKVLAREQEAVFCLYQCNEKNKEGASNLNVEVDGETVSVGRETCKFISTIDQEVFDYYYASGRGDWFQKINVVDEYDPLIVEGWPDFEFDDEYGVSANAFGVHGGLVGLSLAQENKELNEIGANIGGVIALGIISGLGAIAHVAVIQYTIKTGITHTAAQKAVQEAMLGGLQAEAVKSVATTKAASAAAEQGVTIAKETSTAAKEALKNAGTKLENLDKFNPLRLKDAATVGADTAAVGSALVTAITTTIAWTEISSTANPIERQQKAKALVISSAIGAGVTATGIYLSVAGVTASMGPVGWVASIVALVIAGVSAILASGGKTEEASIVAHCEAWQPPLGVDYCKLCDLPVSEGGLAIDDNQGNILRGYECTEYKCRSLGSRCDYIAENVGTDRPKCIGIEVNDVNHPQILEFMVDVSQDMNDVGMQDTGGYLSSGTGDYTFQPDNSLLFNKKVHPYQTVTFGIKLDEPGQCKIDSNIGETFEDMVNFLPDSYYSYVHNQSRILTPNEKFTYYVRCQDNSGNYNIDAFVIEIETTGGDDITPPSIETTSILNNGYVQAEANQTSISLFLNEIVDSCKWSSTDVEFDLMEYSFTCPAVPTTDTTLFDNECHGFLNVVNGSNQYYFACEDASGNKNAQNYPFSLFSTQPLSLDRVWPNGTIYIPEVTLYAETSVGAENGKAICNYGGIPFFNTEANVHTQSLQGLPGGNYVYDIVCMDVAGNQDTSQISFTIEVDDDAPQLTGLYVQEGIVVYDIDESASCQFYFEEFTYGAGTAVSGSFGITDLTTYYLTCQDTFGNEGSYVINI